MGTAYRHTVAHGGKPGRPSMAISALAGIIEETAQRLGTSMAGMTLQAGNPCRYSIVEHPSVREHNVPLHMASPAGACTLPGGCDIHVAVLAVACTAGCGDQVMEPL